MLAAVRLSSWLGLDSCPHDGPAALRVVSGRDATVLVLASIRLASSYASRVAGRSCMGTRIRDAGTLVAAFRWHRTSSYRSEWSAGHAEWGPGGGVRRHAERGPVGRQQYDRGPAWLRQVVLPPGRWSPPSTEQDKHARGRRVRSHASLGAWSGSKRQRSPEVMATSRGAPHKSGKALGVARVNMPTCSIRVATHHAWFAPFVMYCIFTLHTCHSRV